MQKILIKSLLLIIAFTFALSANYIFAVWTGPTQAPPGGNTPTPVHVGTTPQAKDGALSLEALAVFGNALFLSNVGIGTNDPQAKLDVAGGINAAGKIKLGDDSTAPTAGAIRFTGTDFEGYTGTEWKSLTSGDTVQISGDYANCVNVGGNWVDEQQICYFAVATGCPSGWEQKENYSSTVSGDCGNRNPYIQAGYTTCGYLYSSACNTGEHIRNNQPIETCNYHSEVPKTGPKSLGQTICKPSLTCSSTITEIGCVKN